METIVISPYSRKLRNDKRNPKNYPYWDELVQKLNERGFKVTQIGRTDEELINDIYEYKFNLSLKDVYSLIESSYIWISVDNFLQHLINPNGKRGIVLWGKSDPKIFGYENNANLLLDRKFLRERQFDLWETEEYDPNVFVKPDVVLQFI